MLAHVACRRETLVGEYFLSRGIRRLQEGRCSSLLPAREVQWARLMEKSYIVTKGRGSSGPPFYCLMTWCLSSGPKTGAGVPTAH